MPFISDIATSIMRRLGSRARAMESIDGNAARQIQSSGQPAAALMPMRATNPMQSSSGTSGCFGTTGVMFILNKLAWPPATDLHSDLRDRQDSMKTWNAHALWLLLALCFLAWSLPMPVSAERKPATALLHPKSYHHYFTEFAAQEREFLNDQPVVD